MSVDWSQIGTIVGVGASAGAVGSIALGIGNYAVGKWNDTLGRRKAQAKLFDRLACGSSLDYVDSLLGVPMFSGKRGEHDTRTYRLPGAWVIVEIRSAAVHSYSITVTDPKMRYNTRRLTFGCLDVDLGKDMFPTRGLGYEGEHLWVAIRLRHGYVRHYNFREAGAMQFYWLSHNQAGAGKFCDPSGYPDIASGVFKHDINATDPEPVDSSVITANTLTVASPETIHDEVRSGDFLAVDESHVRLASTIDLPDDWSKFSNSR